MWHDLDQGINLWLSGVEANDIMRPFQNVIQTITNLSSVCVCVLCVSVCVFQARHDPCSLENKQFETRDVDLFITCTMWSMVIQIVIWLLFRQMPANQ